MTTTDAASAPVLRCYEMRLTSAHGAENAMLDLAYELRRVGEEDEDWAVFEPSVHASPFLNFLQTTILCQLAYLRMNASERELQLDHVHGFVHLDTTDFRIHRLMMSFAMELRSGSPSPDDLAYLRERCLACPVSQNLGHVETKDTLVTVGNRPEWPDRGPWVRL